MPSFQLHERNPGGACRILQLAIQSCESDALANGKFQISRIVDCQSILFSKREDLAKCSFVGDSVDTDGKREQISKESSGFVLANPSTAHGHEKCVCHFYRPVLRDNCGIT